MDKRWNNIEKGIAIIGILFGLVMLSWFAYSWSDILYNLIEDGHTTWEDISILHLLKNKSAPLLLYVLSVISGILLLKRLKIGWIASILNWIFHACFLLWTVFNMDGEIFIESNKEFLSMICIILILLLIIPVILIQKPIREKYI